ncbi:MAG: integration host factor subunit alpha [Alphaproteobacteria bacterium]|nr:integration host factor subunit alpha [Alphaproteobacteria bacterium]
MTKTITRADIADSLYNELGFSHVESLKLVDSILQVMVDTLTAGEELKVSGFASFIPHKKKSRVGRNPRTGEQHMITPRTVLSFKASHLLKKALLGK